MTESEERAYMDGGRFAWRAMFFKCLAELGYTDEDCAVGRVISQLEDTRAALRILCEDFGDNDWGDSLHLADVVDKHLGRHLYKNYEPLNGEDE